jgi:hypothetical protein
MRDHITLGPTPAEEPCQQLGSPDYTPQLARAECTRFIRAIRHTLGEEPPGATLAVKGFPHDFGTYYEVVCYYEDGNDEATDYAYRAESESPARWPDGV